MSNTNKLRKYYHRIIYKGRIDQGKLGSDTITDQIVFSDYRKDLTLNDYRLVLITKHKTKEINTISIPDVIETSVY